MRTSLVMEAGDQPRPPATVTPSTSSDHWLMCQVGDRVLAVPLAYVVETLRPLPLRPFPDVPHFILGVSVIREAIVPVIDVAALLGVVGKAPARLVTLVLEGRTVAIAVEAVLGLRSLDNAMLHDVPPLLAAHDGALTAIGALDSGLLLVLGQARLVPAEVWARVDAES